MVQFECPRYRNPCVSFTLVWIPFSHFQALLLPLSGVIDYWTPSMKVKKLEISWNKINLTGCKWSNFNAPGIETPLSYILIPFFGLGKSEFVSLIRSSEHRNFESRNFSYLEVSITFCPTLRFPLWHNPFLPQWQTACSTVGTWALSNRGITNELIVAEQDQKFLTHNRAISKWQ